MDEFQASLRSAESAEDLAALIGGGGGDGGPVAWADVTGKPATFPPATHQHAATDINSGTLAFARVPTGTTASTVAVGNHTHPGLLTGSGSAVANATDEASAVTQLNALLAVLRTRGVIST